MRKEGRKRDRIFYFEREIYMLYLLLISSIINERKKVREREKR
jgi:hypothetical protein